MSSLYWIGQYEGLTRKLRWLFEFDLAPAIAYCIMRAIGTGNHPHILCEACTVVTCMNEHTVLLALSCFDRPPHALLVSFSLANWSLCLRRPDVDASLLKEACIFFGTMAVLLLLFFGVGKFVCISASNVDGSDLLS